MPKIMEFSGGQPLNIKYHGRKTNHNGIASGRLSLAYLAGYNYFVLPNASFSEMKIGHHPASLTLPSFVGQVAPNIIRGIFNLTLRESITKVSLHSRMYAYVIVAMMILGSGDHVKRAISGTEKSP
jgi:hypothetical protein